MKTIALASLTFLTVAVASVPADARQDSTEAQGSERTETGDGEVVPADDPSNENLAAELTRRHQLQQTYTIRRTVNGEVIETTERSVAFKDGRPVLPTEAGQSIEQRLKASFDRELLTRTEALDEARLNFALGDVDRDGAITAPEFERLLDVLGANVAPPSGEPGARAGAFVAGLDGDRASLTFAAFAGPETLSLDERAFGLAFLTQFDEADRDGDALLRGEEIKTFRRVFGD